MKTDITIVLRDVNGNRCRWSFLNEEQACKACLESLTDEDEILVVAQGGVCLYSALNHDHTLSVGDLAAFFA